MHPNSNLNSDTQKPVIVLGTGGHAKVLIEALRLSGRKIMGLTDPGQDKGSECFNIKVLGNDDAVFKFTSNEVELVNGVGFLPGESLRLKLTIQMETKGYMFSQVIHPSAVIASDVVLGNGAQIMAGVLIQPGVRIGRSCIINTGVIIDHDCEINDYCHISPGATLSGGVVIGKGTHIGTGTAITQGIAIGVDCIVAAGSIIHKNIASNTKYIKP